MNITPVIPDGYDGPIKQLTCRVCKRFFYVTKTDYSRLEAILYCHECSLILREELTRSQGPQGKSPPELAPLSVLPPPRKEPVVQKPFIPVPQPRTIDREKMTVEQLLEEAKMLCKTWRDKEALSSYDQILQQEPACLEALSQKASLLHQANHSSEALITYERLLQLDPESAEAYVGKGWALTSLRRHEESLTAFDQALHLDPSSRQARFGKWFVLDHLHREREKEAFSPWEAEKEADKQCVAQPCHTAEDYYKKGIALVSLDREKDALQAFEACLGLDPLYLDAYERMSRVYLSRDKHEDEKALAVFDRALSVSPDCAKLHRARGSVLMRLKRYQEALLVCDQALRLDPTEYLACLDKGECLYHLGKYQEALHVLDDILILHPNFQMLYRQKAKVLAKLRRHEDALELYDQMIRLDPIDFFSYKSKIDFLMKIGREEDALATYNQFIERTPHVFKGYQEKLFFLLIDRERYTDALTTCEQCLARNPEMAQAHEWKGRTLCYLKRYEEALLAYEEALKRDARNEDLYVGKARVLTNLKRYDEALTVCEQVIQRTPAKSSAYKEKADILTRQKCYEEALSAYQKAAQLDPEDAFVYEQIGDTFCELERFAEAVKIYDRALHLRPGLLRVYSSQASAFEKLGRYDQALIACNKGLQKSPRNLSFLCKRAGVFKKLMRYEEANADYDQIERIDPKSLYVVASILESVDLARVARAKERLKAVGKELSDETIKAEVHVMWEEEQATKLKASLRGSLLFQPLCLLMREQQEWSGTSKQFKELLWVRFPDSFAKWYKSPSKYVDELKKIAPELQEEGIGINFSSKTGLITLTKPGKENSQPPDVNARRILRPNNLDRPFSYVPARKINLLLDPNARIGASTSFDSNAHLLCARLP